MLTNYRETQRPLGGREIHFAARRFSAAGNDQARIVCDRLPRFGGAVVPGIQVADRYDARRELLVRQPEHRQRLHQPLAG